MLLLLYYFCFMVSTWSVVKMGSRRQNYTVSGENMSWRVVCTQSRREGLERGIHKSLHWPVAEMSAVLAMSLDKAQVYKEDALSSYYLEHNV